MKFPSEIKLFHLLQSTLAKGFQHSVLYSMCLFVVVCMRVCVCPGAVLQGKAITGFHSSTCSINALWQQQETHCLNERATFELVLI